MKQRIKPKDYNSPRTKELRRRKQAKFTLKRRNKKIAKHSRKINRTS